MMNGWLWQINQSINQSNEWMMNAFSKPLKNETLTCTNWSALKLWDGLQLWRQRAKSAAHDLFVYVLFSLLIFFSLFYTTLSILPFFYEGNCLNCPPTHNGWLFEIDFFIFSSLQIIRRVWVIRFFLIFLTTEYCWRCGGRLRDSLVHHGFKWTSS